MRARTRRESPGRDPRQEGAAAVEFAMVLPVLVLLLFGTIQMGLAFFEWQGLQAAAREATRLASFSNAPQWSEIEARALDAAARVQGGDIVVELESAGAWSTPAADDKACDGTNEEVRIRVKYLNDYQINAIFFNQAVPMTAEAVFRCETQP